MKIITKEPIQVLENSSKINCITIQRFLFRLIGLKM